MAIITDTFAGTVGTALTSHTADTGQSWITAGDHTYTLSGAGLLVPAALTGECTALITDAALDISKLHLQITWAVSPVTGECSFLFYCPGGGSGDYVLLQIGANIGVDLDIWTRISGSYTNLRGTGSSNIGLFTPGNTYTLDIYMGGGEGHLLVAGVEYGHFVYPKATMDSFRGNTYIGLRCNKNVGQESGASRYSAFSADLWS